MLQDTTPVDDTERGLWITTQLDDTGTYQAQLIVDNDETIPFTPEVAQRWSAHILGAVAVADYEEAILAQLGAVGASDHDVAVVIARMRPQYILPKPVLGSLRVEPAVQMKTRKAFLKVLRHGAPYAIWETPEAAAHALSALQLVNLAAMDTLYLEHLIAHGLDHPQARMAITQLQSLRGA